VTENSSRVAVWGASTNPDGSLAFGMTAQVPVQPGRVEHPVVLPINVDHDSYSLVYSPEESELVFTEPVLVAALSAPPCYASGQNSGACVTSFGQAESTGSEQDWSVTLSASIIIGLSSGVNVPFVKVEAETEHKISLALSYTGSHAYQLVKSVTFTTGPLEDTVVFTSVPYDKYTYRILDHPDPAQVGQRIAYFVPREPVTLQVERGFYDEHIVQDATRVGSNVFTHRIGDPSSYPTAADRDPYVSIPRRVTDVSPCHTSTSSGETPSPSATIWDHEVSCPCPCGDVPVRTITFPNGRHSISAASHPPATYRSAPRIAEGASPHISM